MSRHKQKYFKSVSTLMDVCQ